MTSCCCVPTMIFISTFVSVLASYNISCQNDYYDMIKNCTECLGNRDINKNCLECEIGWTNLESDCTKIANKRHGIEMDMAIVNMFCMTAFLLTLYCSIACFSGVICYAICQASKKENDVEFTERQLRCMNKDFSEGNKTSYTQIPKNAEEGDSDTEEETPIEKRKKKGDKGM